MKKFYLPILCLLFFSRFSNAQYADCSNALIICGNTQPFNPSGIGSKLEQLACGGIEHNSVWLAFQAKANGKLNFAIRAFTLAGLPVTADFDWSLFSIPGPPNSGNCDAKTQISCNFAGTSTVYGIPGTTGMATPNYAATAFNPGVDVVSGNWYMLLVDQFSNTTPLLFSVQFTDNPEVPYINSTPAIFNNRPNFSFASTGGCNGTYTFTNSSFAAAGIGSYSWDFGDGSSSTLTNPTHTFVTPGTYYVTLTMIDANGCRTDIRRTIVYNNTPPVINNAGLLILPSCTDVNNGSITITTTGATTPGVTGGTPPYTFETVSPSPVILPPQSSNTFTGLAPGIYTVKVTDACGKSAINTTTINVAQIATSSTIGMGIQNIQSSCVGSATGSATIFTNGTVPPYTMQLVASSPVTTGVLPTVQRDPVTSTYFTTFTNLLPGSYTVEAVDGCGKARRATFTVTASTFPTVAVTNSASCAGTATGTINVTATAATGLTTSGSPGSFQYALIAPSPIIRTYQNSSVFENLLPGTYTVAVKDVCGNVGITTSTIASSPSPTFGTAFTTLSCPNGATGTIEAQVSAVGGGSPHTFELISPSPVTRPPQTDNTFANLPPGVYTIRLTDVCGTQVSSTVTVSAGVAPTFTTAVTGSCLSPASGTVTVTPAANTIGPFSFELISPGAAIRPIQGSNIANTNNSIFTALDQGIYTVRMTDGCGVPVTSTVTITAPTALAFPAGSSSIPSCVAGSTGQLTIAQPTTGLGAYKYEIIAPSPVTRAPQYSRIFNNLPVGSYTVRITDSCGTQVTSGATIDILSAAAPTLTATATSSCASASGTITVITGNNQGGGTYQYALIAPSPVTRPNQASPIFTGLPSGAYTIQITDQCGATGTTTLNVDPAGAFTPAAGGSVVSCNGSSYSGQIIVTNPQNFTTGGPIPPGSGGGPYMYALYDATNTTLLAGPQSSNIFGNVIPAAGNPSHTVRVTDACGNTSVATLALNPPTPLTNGTISAITASCGAASTGVIRVTTVAAGGFTPYTYTLLDATTNAIVKGPQSSVVFTDVPANTVGYLLRSTDACGNSNTTAVALAFPSSATPTASVATTASCASPATGKIVVTPGTGATLAGGTFTYAVYDAGNTVLVSGPQASPVFTNLAPNTYTVRIIDRCGTTGSVSATIASGATALTAAGVSSGTCSGGTNGSITSSFTGGSLPVTYTLVNSITTAVVAGPQASNIFGGLAAGTYVVRVTDACGTVANSTDIILGDLTTAPSISTTVALDCSGSATIGAYGGSGSGGPYTYAICSGAGCSVFSSYTTNSIFTITSSGAYRISVKDRCGNTTNMSTDIVVTIPTKPGVTAISNANACGSTTITPSFSGVPNTPYFSIDGANFTPTLPTITPGCHTFRVADFNAGAFGCASDAYSFEVIGAATITPPTPANWSVTCTPLVTPSVVAGSGSPGCSGNGASLQIKLVSCTGCAAGADPIGTKKPVGATFNLRQATAATFEPVVTQAGIDICAGAQVSATFNAPPFNCSTLPTGILTFAGQREGNVNKLRWTTSSEQNNRGFMLQRSADGSTYTDIAFINSLATGGNSNDAIEYSFGDNTFTGTKQYYRLRQEDLDGRTRFSTTVLIRSGKPVTLAIGGIFPNPATADINVILDAPSKDKVTLLITDATGKSVIRQQVNVEAGSNTVPVNIASLANGTYLVKLVCTGNCETVIGKFIKQ